MVGKGTVLAALYPRFQPGWIASAFIAQGIERTIAKQAIEFLNWDMFVAREVFTVFVLKKRIFGHFSPPS